MHIADLETPAVIIDLDIMDANIERMQNFLSSNGIDCRPHAKTHKIPAVAHRQLTAGAIGITCQKLSEAEVMVNAGITDIFVPYNIVGDHKLDRLERLVRQAQMRVTVDSEVTLRGISERMNRSGLSLEVLVECDLGAGRCGVQSVDEAVNLSVQVNRLPGVEFKGLMTYKGGAPDLKHIERSGTFFEESVQALRHHGIDVDVITAGGTVYALNAWPENSPYGVTESRPGVYVFNDRVKVAQGVATDEDCALRVICTVVSAPTKNRYIIDGGSKTFTMNGAPWVVGFGSVIEYPEATMPKMSEEHGYLDMSKSYARPNIGDRVTLVPNYVNSLLPVHERVYGLRNDRVETIWPVAAAHGIH